MPASSGFWELFYHICYRWQMEYKGNYENGGKIYLLRLHKTDKYS